MGLSHCIFGAHSVRIMAEAVSLRKNMVANFVGRSLVGLMGFLFVPLYLKYMGAESYGLIGFWTTLAGVFAVFDCGVRATLNREIARLSGTPGGAEKIPELLFTFERINWAVGAAIGSIVAVLSGPIAHHWIHAAKLSEAVVQHAVLLIGLAILLEWPWALYKEGLNGLQCQVVQNVISVSMTAIRNIGVLGILVWISPTVTAFLVWQIGAYAVQFWVSRTVLWRLTPSSNTPRQFRAEVLRPLWRFAAGMGGITLTGIILAQADSIILSKMIPLDQFGYYSLAKSVVAGLTMLAAPVFVAVYPRLSQLIAMGEHQHACRLYHLSCQIVAISVLPTAIVAGVFSDQIITLWTRNAELAVHVHTLVSVLAIGAALNLLMSVPYALQYASGWTSLVFWMNVFCIVLLVPAMIASVLRWGPVGAATAGAIVNGLYVLVAVTLMHRRLLRGQTWRWYIEDAILPCAAATATVTVGRLLIARNLKPIFALPEIFIVLLAAFVASAGAASSIRCEIRVRLASRWR